MSERSAIAKKRYTFVNALGQIPRGRFVEVKNRLCKVLGFADESTWYRCLNGYSPRLGAARAVEQVFAEFGVTDCWDEVVEQ